MRTLLLAALAAGAAFIVAPPAEARQGCGVGAHRAPNGYCRPNRDRVVVAPRLRIGGFYHGRGYWDGRRYWGHRFRSHGGWRYR